VFDIILYQTDMENNAYIQLIVCPAAREDAAAPLY